MTQPDLSDLISVTFVYDPTLGSPIELQPQGGKVIALPPSYFPLPQRDSLLGVLGFSRQDGVGGWQWVLQGSTDPVDQFVDALVPGGTWANASSRATVRLMVARLLSVGVPRTTIANQVPAFVAAIRDEVLAEQAANP